jgi:hypothetical protein
MSARVYFLLIGVVFFIGIQGKPLLTAKLPDRINHLLNITGSENKFNSVLNTYIASDPNLSLYKTEITSFIDKFLSYQSLRPHIVKIYSDLYTLAEVNGMIKFYTSPLGKKIVEKEAKAEIRLTQLIKNQIQKQMPQIITWFQQALNKDYSKAELDRTIKSMK